LVDANKTWAKNAAVLVVFISRKLFDHDNESSVTHSYDCGAAWENFALQGFHQRLVVHGMEGFDYERARKELRIPDESKSKRWPQLASRVRKNCFLKSCRRAKALTIGGNFRKASLRDRLGLNSF
jgi:hypothetical protein